MARRGLTAMITWLFIGLTALYASYRVVDGGFTEWSGFTQCSVSCGGGTQSRTRSCTNPIPKYGGRRCSALGPSVETVKCNPQPCPIDGKYGNWGEFGSCSVACGGGVQKRERKCDNPEPQHGGKDCKDQGEAEESKACNENPCPVDGKYSEWGKFGTCSASCGGGTHKRERICNNPVPQHGGKSCAGSDEETVACNENPCPVTVNGNYSAWSDWSACSTTCGPGQKTRTRECNNPLPVNGGKSCKDQNMGEAVQSVECNLQPCSSGGNAVPV